LKLFSEVRGKTFTKEDISADWRGTGLTPYNPAVVLKWLSAWEKVRVKKVTFSTSSDSPHGVKPNLTNPKTPKSARGIENLFAEVQLSHTERPGGPLESPINSKLEKLCKPTIQACTEADIQLETNKPYEGHK
jgi:hypothetical protein